MSEKKSKLLGQSFGKASNQLRKMVMFNMAQKLDLCNCYRCEEPIEDVKEFSIEHKNSWQDAVDPIVAFFNIEDIAYSHLSCNSGAARHSRTKFSSREEMLKFHTKKDQNKRNARRKKWRAGRREAGLPYT